MDEGYAVTIKQSLIPHAIQLRLDEVHYELKNEGYLVHNVEVHGFDIAVTGKGRQESVDLWYDREGFENTKAFWRYKNDCDLRNGAIPPSHQSLDCAVDALVFAQKQLLNAFGLYFDADIKQLKYPIIQELAFNFLSAADYRSYRRQDMMKVQNDWQSLSKRIDPLTLTANLLLAMDSVFEASILDLSNAVSLQEMRSRKISSARKRASGLTLTMAKFLDRCLISDLTNFQIMQLLADGKVFISENTLKKMDYKATEGAWYQAFGQ